RSRKAGEGHAVRQETTPSGEKPAFLLDRRKRPAHNAFVAAEDSRRQGPLELGQTCPHVGRPKAVPQGALGWFPSFFPRALDSPNRLVILHYVLTDAAFFGQPKAPFRLAL